MIKEWSPKGTMAQMLNALSSCWCGLSAARISGEERKRERLYSFLYCSGKSSEQNGINHSIGRKYEIETSAAKIIPAPDNKFEIINHHVVWWAIEISSFCYTFLFSEVWKLGIITSGFRVAGPGDLGSIPGRVIPKTQKMVLDASLFNTQHYKVQIKGKVEQSREGVAPSPTHWCSSYRKGSLRVTLDYGRQLYLLYFYVRVSLL